MIEVNNDRTEIDIMKKCFAIFIPILILIEQGVKLIIANTFPVHMDVCIYPCHEITLIDGFLYFHPILNSGFAITTVRFLALFNIDISGVPRTPIFMTIGTLIVIGFALLFSLHSLYVTKKHKVLVYCFFSFVVAGAVCAWIDVAFWGGSLDYIGLFDWFIFDLKDAYMFAFLPFYILWYGLYLRDYMKLSKEERKQEKLETNSIKWIKNGCPSER